MQKNERTEDQDVSRQFLTVNLRKMSGYKLTPWPSDSRWARESDHGRSKMK